MRRLAAFNASANDDGTIDERKSLPVQANRTSQTRARAGRVPPCVAINNAALDVMLLLLLLLSRRIVFKNNKDCCFSFIPSYLCRSAIHSRVIPKCY